MSNFVLYILVDPKKLEDIRYVGITNDTTKRLREHLAEAKRGFKDYRCNWIRKLLALNRVPLLEIIEFNLTLEEACNNEIALIRVAKEVGHHLTNITAGGQGAFGIPISDNLRNKLKGNTYRRGKKTPEKTKELLRVALLGNTNSKDKRWSVKSKRHQAEVQRGRKHTPETKEKMRQKALQSNAHLRFRVKP